MMNPTTTTRRAARLVGAVALIVGAAACSSDDDASDDAEETVDADTGADDDAAGDGDAAGADAGAVSIVDFTFAPDPIEVSRGTTITWINNDGVPHTVTGTGDLDFDSGSIGAGESFELVIEAEGEFPYVCTIHGQMSGSVIVS